MPRDYQILLIADNPADASIIERALRDGAIDHRLSVVHDAAVSLLDPAMGRRVEPDLILLTINRGTIEESGILTEIKNDPVFSTVPVLILNLAEADQAGVGSDIRKPSNFPRDLDLVRTLQAYWREALLKEPDESYEP